MTPSWFRQAWNNFFGARKHVRRGKVAQNSSQRLRFERLEERDVPAANIIIQDAVGNLDSLLTPTNGTITAADVAALPGTDATLSRTALQTVGVGVNISIIAPDAITFSDLSSPINLQTSTGNTVVFQANTTTISFIDRSDLLSTAGATLTLSAPNGLVLGSLSTGNGNLALTGNTIDIGTAATVNAGTGKVTVAPFTGGQAISIDLGGADSLGTTLGLTRDEMARITAGIVKIGDSGSGAVSVSETLDLDQLGRNYVLSLQTGLGVTQQAGDNIKLHTLAVQAVNDVVLTNAGNDVELVAGRVTGTDQDFSFTDTDSFTVATVDPTADNVVGIQTGTGVNARIVLSGGNLIVDQAAGSRLVTTTLSLNGVAAFSLTDQTNAVANLSANLTGANQPLSYVDSNQLNINGITTNGGSVSVATVNGDLVVVDSNGAANPDIVAGTGSVSLTAGSSGNDNILDIQAGAAVRTLGAVTLTADRVNVGATVGDTGNVSNVTIRPFETNTQIGLGTAGDPTGGVLNLSDAELNRIVADVVTVGRNDANAAGNITVTAPISLAAANVNELSLVTGGSIIDSNVAAGPDITVTQLGLTAATGVASLANPLETSVGSLEAIVSTNNGLFIDNANRDLTIGGVNGTLSGIDVAGGNIRVRNTDANITLVEDVTNTGGGNIDVGTVVGTSTTPLNLTLNAAVGTSGGTGTINLSSGNVASNSSGSITTTGGDITVSGTTNVSTNAPVSVLGGGTGSIQITADSDNDGNGDLSIGSMVSTSSATTGGTILLSGQDTTIGGAVSAPTANITVRGRDIDFGTLGSITTTVPGEVFLLTRTPTTSISIGTDPGGTLGLTNADLNKITAPVLNIGDSAVSAQSGNILFTAPVTLDPLKVPTLSLETTGAMVDNVAGETGAFLTVQSLALRAGAGIGTADDIDTAVSNLVALNTRVPTTAASGDINIENTIATLTIPTAAIDGLTGVTNAALNGQVLIKNTGAMVIDGPVQTTGAGASNISLTVGGPAATIVKTANGSVKALGGGNGNVVIGSAGSTPGSTVTVNHKAADIDVQATGTGNVTLSATDTVTVGASAIVEAASGNVTLTSNNSLSAGVSDVLLGTNSILRTEGNVSVNADPDGNGIGGGITMGDGSVINGSSSAAAQNVTLTAAKDIRVTQINADNNITITNTGNLGNIVDDDSNPLGESTALVAGSNVILTGGGHIGKQSIITTADIESADTGNPSANYLAMIDVNYGNQLVLSQIGALGNIQVRRVGGGVETSDIAFGSANLIGNGNQLVVVSTGGNFTVDSNFSVPANFNADVFFATADETSGSDLGYDFVINAAKSLVNNGANATTSLMASGGASSEITGPTADNSADVTVQNLRLYSTGGKIGADAANPLEINAVTLGGFTTGKVNNVAQPGGNVFLTDTANGVAITQINAGTANVTLTSRGNVTPTGPSLTAVIPNDNVAEIVGNVINLAATGPTTGTGGQIGQAGNFFEVDSNVLSASTNNSNFWISEVGAGANAGTQIGLVTAGTTAGTTTGFLRVRNGGNIVSQSIDGTPDVVAPVINLSTVAGDSPAGGNFGTSLASPLQIDATTLNSNLAGGGNLFVQDTTGGLTVQRATTTAGNIGIEAAGNGLLTVGNGSSSGNAVQATGTGATVVLKANTMNITATGLVNAPRVILVTSDATATSIDLGGVDGANTLGLTNAELGAITTPVLQIGGDPLNAVTASGVPINVTAAIALANANVPTLDLSSGGAISESGGGSLAVTNLALRAGGTATLNGNNDADTLAASVNGDLVFKDADGLTLDTVDGLGNVTIPNANRVELNAGGAVTQTANGTVTGGSLLLLGAGSFNLSNTTNNVATLAGNTTGGATYKDADALAIGSVNGTNGLTTANAAVDVSTVNGDLTVNQNISAGIGSVALTTGGANNLLTNSAAIAGNPVTFTSDRMALAGGTVDAGGAGVVTLKATTAGRPVDLGSAVDTNAALELSNAELNSITAGGAVRVGATAAGPVVVTQAINAASYSTLHLTSGGSITDTGTGSLTVASLAAEGATVVLDSVSNAVGAVAGVASAAGSPAFHLVDNIGVTIGTVDGVDGISAANGGVTVTSGGAVTVNNTAAVTDVLAGGPINITGTSLTTNAGAAANSSNNPIVLTADNMAFAGAINSGTARTSLLVRTAGQLVDLGGADAANTLGLTAGEINTITAGAIQVGSRSGVASGAMTVSAAIAPTGTLLLVLESGGGVTATGGSIVENDLAVRANGTVTLAGANDVSGALAIETTVAAAGVTFNDINALTVGTVDGLSGVTGTGGAVGLTANGGDLTINQNVSTGAAAITLTANGTESIFTNNAAISNSGGNTVSIGGNRMALAAGTVSAAGGGRVILHATTAGRPVNLGPTTDPTGSINLSAAELNTITTGTLQIGQGTEGNVDVGVAIALPSAPTLSIQSNGSVAGTGTLSVINLRISGAAGVTLAGGNDVDTFAAASTQAGAGVVFNDVDDLTVGTVDGASDVATNAGAVTLTAGGSGGLLTNSAAIVGSPVSLTADRMALASGTVDAGGAGVVTLKATTAGRPVDIGSPIDTNAALELSNAELNSITAGGAVRVGTAAAGPVVVTQAINATSYSTLHLTSGGTITDTGAGSLAVGSLAAEGTTVVFDAAANNVGTLAGVASAVGSPAFNFIDVDNVAIGTVDGVNGIAAASGGVTITSGGQLTVNNTAAVNDILAGGSIALTGNAFISAAGALVDSTSNPIVVTADNMTLGGAINSGSARTSLLVRTGGTLINLGGTDSAGTLGLTAAELNTVTAGILQVGSRTGTASGAMTISGTIAPSGTSVLDLESGGAVTTAGGTISETDLSIRAVGAVSLGNANDITGSLAIAVSGSGSGVAFNDATGLAIGIVDGLSGVTTNNGTIALTAGSGDLTVNQNVIAGNANITLTANGTDSFVTNNAAVSNAAGNTIDVGANRMALAGGTISAAGSGRAILHATTAGRTVSLGSALDPTGTLSLSAAELGTVSGGLLQLGQGIEGNVAVSGSVSLSAVPTLSVRTNGNVAGAGSLAVGTLRLTTTTGVNLTGSNDVDTFASAASQAGAAIAFNDIDGLTVGTADGLSGVSANGGAVSLTAGGNNNLLTNNAAITGASANLSADRMSLAGGTINVANGLVSLAPVTTGQPVNFNNSAGDPVGALQFTQTELSTITAGTLRVGSATAGNMTVESAITSPTTTLSLVSGGRIGQTTTVQTVSAVNLRLQGATGVDLQGANVVYTIAGGTNSTSTFKFGSAAPSVTIGTVDGVAGITSPNGQVTIAANNLAVTANVTATGLNGLVNFKPFDGAVTNINIGGADSPTTLGLTDAELDRVKTNVLRIGDTSISTPIAVTAPITGAGNYSTLSLKTAGSLAQTAGSRISGTNFSFETGSISGTAANRFQIGVNQVAGKVASGSIFLASNTPGTVTSATPLDGVTGLTAGAGGTASLVSSLATANAYAMVDNAYLAYAYSYQAYLSNPGSINTYYAYIQSVTGYQYAQAALTNLLAGNRALGTYYAQLAATTLDSASRNALADYFTRPSYANSYYSYLYALRGSIYASYVVQGL